MSTYVIRLMSIVEQPIFSTILIPPTTNNKSIHRNVMEILFYTGTGLTLSLKLGRHHLEYEEGSKRERKTLKTRIKVRVSGAIARYLL